jgi:hypothetical protein
MINIRDVAKMRGVSEKVARRWIDNQIVKGLWVREKERDGKFLYYQKDKLSNFKWHDPFNKAKPGRVDIAWHELFEDAEVEVNWNDPFNKANKMARPVPEMQAEDAT